MHVRVSGRDNRGQIVPVGHPDLVELDDEGYFVATGHFRDGILLAPVTAVVMRQAIAGQNPGFDLTAMSPQRFMPKC